MRIIAPRYASFLPALIALGGVFACSLPAAEPTPNVDSKPSQHSPPPSKFFSGTPLRADKVAIAPGAPDPYRILSQARSYAESRTLDRNLAGTRIIVDYYSSSVYLALAYLQLQAGDREEALASLRAAERASRFREGARPHHLKWPDIAAMFAAAGDDASADRLFRDAAIEVDPDQRPVDDDALFERVEVIAVLVDRLHASGRFNAARELSQAATNRVRRMKANHPLYSANLSRLCEMQLKLGDRTAAFAAARSIRDVEDDIDRDEFLGKVLKAQVHVDDLAGAAATARLLAADSFAQYEMIGLARAYAEHGDYSEAIACALRIGDDQYRSEALLAVAEMQVAAGDIAHAVAAIGQIEYQVHGLEALIALGAAYLNDGDEAAARATLDEAAALAIRALTSETHVRHHLGRLVRQLASLQHRANFTVEARRLLADAAGIANEYRDNDVVSIEAILFFAAAQRNIGDRAGARATLSFADAHLRGNDRLQYDCWKRVDVAKAYHEFGDQAQAAATLAEALKQLPAVEKSKYHLAGAMTRIAWVQAEFGDQPAAHASAVAALAEARKLPLKTEFSALLPPLADAFAAAGDYQAAEDLFAEMSNADLAYFHQEVDRRNETIGTLVRNGRAATLLQLAERSRSFPLYRLIAAELFRMQGVAVKQDREWSLD